ncbi:MAG: trehalose-phosphatase [Gemmatimonadaceae bacterium]|nr:trehalose-phosphatase [Gemmatimonadaceae bacterium]
MSRNVLAGRNVELLRECCGAGSLLAFDFDGTLAPLGPDAHGTRMRTETAELLRALAHAAPVAVITGRSVADATGRLEGIPMLAVIGNHGAEPSRFAARAAREVAGWLPLLEAALATCPGAVIENKGQSVSVHYWHAESPPAVLQAVEAVVPALPHRVTVVHGTCLVNLVPRGAPDKGDALARLITANGLPGAVFAGDELTDEPAFRCAQSSPAGMGVRVGRLKSSAAAFHVDTQLDVDALLTEMLVGCSRQARSRNAGLAAATSASGSLAAD